MKKRFLAVDGESGVLWMLEKFLSRKGYQIATATNAFDALQSCERGKPDLVLIDYHIKGMNGIDLVKALRTSFPELPVILTGGEEEMQTADATHYEACHFLSKPIDSDHLLKRIEFAIRPTEVNSSLETNLPAGISLLDAN